jgi:beta-aspartyl-peptidase (threonine type)
MSDYNLTGFTLIAFLLLAGCTGEPVKEINAEPEILELLKQQQNAWNQGDIDSFMAVYDNTEELSFVTSGGLLKGYEALRLRYHDSYPNKDRMGKLNFDILEYKQLDNEHAVVIGQWVLVREDDMPQGYFTLLWERKEDGWKIIYDHTS